MLVVQPESTALDGQGETQMAEQSASEERVNVVLVHGAFADGSGWQKVIPLLEQAGYYVTAVQNPLIAFADDIATTKRVIDAQIGPVIAVGHSYGGAVITEAANDNPNVKALVFVAALAPDAGETLTAGYELFEQPDLLTALVPDAADFAYVDRAKFHDVFAADVDSTEASIMATTQKPIFNGIFGAVVEKAAWRSIPSWSLIALEDRSINPKFQRYQAERMNAKVTEVQASHVPFVSQPEVVANVIMQAANESVLALA
jgi:pimeloyl-ACP methyl ester carboxylesterase